MDIQDPIHGFFMGGFECSAHRRCDGHRLDLLASTQHDRFAGPDYRQLHALGLRTLRDGLRWHLIETAPRHYDWSSFLPMLRAAHRAEVQVVWDLCHYGWPDSIDIWSPTFIERFACFAGAVARVVQEETGAVPFFCPINEISFWAWAGGEVAHINPWMSHRGGDLKRQLARAVIAAIEAVRAVNPRARFICAEPAIHVSSQSSRHEDQAAAEFNRLNQYEACDLICGRLEPEIGGQPDYLDVVGVNYYPQNQWINGSGTIPLGHHSYRPFHEMLKEVQERYGRPVLVSETGAEGSARPSWLHYVCAEAREAMAQGVPVLGICLYPILDYPGWDNDRCCKVGLLSSPDANGHRSICAPLLAELKRQQLMMEPHNSLGNGSLV